MRRRWLAVVGLVLLVLAVAVVVVVRQEPDDPELSVPAQAWPPPDELRACPNRVDSDVDDSGMRAPVNLAGAIVGHRAWATYAPEALDEPDLEATGRWTASAEGLLDAATVEATVGAEADDEPLDGVVSVDLGVLDRAHGESQRGATVSLLITRPNGVELAVSERPDGTMALVACLPPAEEEGEAQLQRYLRRSQQDVGELARSLLEDPSALDDFLEFHRSDTA